MGAPPGTGGKGLGRRPIARRTGKPAKHMPGAISQAARLSEPEIIARLHLTQEHIDFLDQCAAGHPPRNALASIQAIKLKLDFTTRKPRQEVEVVTPNSTADLTDEEWSTIATLRHQVRNG